MARKSDSAQQLLAAFLKLPAAVQIGLVAVIVVGGVVWYFATRTPAPDPGPPLPPGAKTVMLCHWNMENLFDDKDDDRPRDDEPFDDWFANNHDDRRAKYEKLAAWLLTQNNGIGPDVIVGNEIENRRAAELLQQELNAKLPPDAVKFGYVAMEENRSGRHIAPCVISRYPLTGARMLDSRRRILEVRVKANEYELLLVASHWTSKVSDKTGESRDKYAAIIYDTYTAAHRGNPKLDYLVCGDFNDTPDSGPIAGTLRLTGDPALVTTTANPPRLFGPLSGKDPKHFATVNYGKPEIFDHVGLSAGMLDDEGWGYVADSVRVPTEGLTRSTAAPYRPWRFGSRTDKAVGRGFADHFPVVVTLKVAP
jgi:hypothetical protein